VGHRLGPFEEFGWGNAPGEGRFLEKGRGGFPLGTFLRAQRRGRSGKARGEDRSGISSFVLDDGFTVRKRIGLD